MIIDQPNLNNIHVSLLQAVLCSEGRTQCLPVEILGTANLSHKTLDCRTIKHKSVQETGPKSFPRKTDCCENSIKVTNTMASACLTLDKSLSHRNWMEEIQPMGWTRIESTLEE